MRVSFFSIITVVLVVLVVLASCPAGTAADFDVTHFGALADGVSDSAPGIQATIDAAARAGGGRILLPAAPAPYLIRDTLRVNSSGIEIFGPGAKLLLARGAIDGRIAEVMLFAGTEDIPIRNVALRGLTIDANYFDQVGARGSKAVVFRFVEEAIVEDVAITRPYVGLSFRRSVRAEARRVTITDYEEDAFDAGGDADLVSGGMAKAITFVDVVARDALRSAKDGNAFEIEDGVQGILIRNALIENVAGNGIGLRNHNTGQHLNHSSDVELRNVEIRRTGGKFAVFGVSAPRETGATNSYSRISLVDVRTDGAVAFWGPVSNLRLTGGTYAEVHIGFDETTGPALVVNALRDATLEHLHAGLVRINSASEQIVLSGVDAASISNIEATTR